MPGCLISTCASKRSCYLRLLLLSVQAAQVCMTLRRPFVCLGTTPTLRLNLQQTNVVTTCYQTQLPAEEKTNKIPACHWA